MFQTKVVEKIKTHIMCSVTLFEISCCFFFGGGDDVEKYVRAEQAIDDNVEHALCMLDT